MRIRQQASILVLATVLLTGCGINALRVQSASEVSLAAGAVVSQANASLDDVKARRIKAYVSFVASDPSCSPTDEVYIYVPNGPPDPKLAPPPLCASSKDATLAGYSPKLLHFNAATSDRLKPTILLIAAVAEYGDAMGTIADRPDADVSKILASAASKASDAKVLAEGLLSIKLPGVPDPTSGQVKAATELVQMLVSLTNEAQKVKDIRKLFAEKNHVIASLLPTLNEQIALWSEATTQGYAQINEESLRRGYDNERAKLGFEGRSAFIQLVRQAHQDSTSVARTSAAFTEAVDELQKSNNGLDDLLSGRLTPEQKAKASQISKGRILHALQLIANAATAWGVI